MIHLISDCGAVQRAGIDECPWNSKMMDDEAKRAPFASEGVYVSIITHEVLDFIRELRRFS